MTNKPSFPLASVSERALSPAPSRRPRLLRRPATLRIKVDYVPPSGLKFFRTRLRKHSERSYKAVIASLHENDCVLPLLIDKDNQVVAGEMV